MAQNHKITLLLPSLNDGGAERAFLNLAGDFLRRGYDVELLLYKTFGPYLEQLPAGLSVYSLRARTPFGALWQLVRHIHKHRPAHILSALPEANLLNIAARHLGGRRYRCLISEHTILSENLRLYRARFAHRLKHFLVRRLYRHADAIITVSRAAAADLAPYAHIRPEKIPEKIHIIDNPVYAPAILEKAAQDPNHTWLSADKSTRGFHVLLSVGRFVPEKDHLTLLEAFHILKPKRPVRLILLGGGAFEHVVREKISALDLGEDDIFIGGFVANPYAFMARADAFVLHSTHEGFGNVLIEAMATGTPVISTRSIGGAAEILEDGRWGPLPPAKNPAALAAAIENVLDSPPHSAAAYQARARHFSVERAGDEYLRLILNAPP